MLMVPFSPGIEYKSFQVTHKIPTASYSDTLVMDNGGYSSQSIDFTLIRTGVMKSLEESTGRLGEGEHIVRMDGSVLRFCNRRLSWDTHTAPLQMYTDHHFYQNNN